MTHEERKAYNGGTKQPTVGMFANFSGYSDTSPYEIIAVSPSGKTLTIRSMTATELPWKKDYHVGGFSGHLANQRDQKWDIKSDPNGHVTKIRLSVRNGRVMGWQNNGQNYGINSVPHKFYDYNF